MDQLKSNLPMIALFTILYVASFQIQVYLIYPLELELGWEITHKASIFFIPAGVQLFPWGVSPQSPRGKLIVHQSRLLQ